MSRPRLHSIRIGDTMWVFDDTTRAGVEAKARRALSRGDTVVWEDKTRQWIDTFVLVDTSKEGSAQYKWRGDKVLADVFLVTKHPSGQMDRKKIGQRYVSWE